MIKIVIKYMLFAIIIIVVTIVGIDLYVKNSAKKYIYSDITKVPKNNVALLLGTAKYINVGKDKLFL